MHQPSRLKMIILLNTECHTQKWNLSKYISEALRNREVYVCIDND